MDSPPKEDLTKAISASHNHVWRVKVAVRIVTIYFYTALLLQEFGT